MKTPEEIKQLLANHRDYTFNLQELLTDALALIEQLEHERDEARQERDGLSIMLTSAESAFETMKHERDAAVADLKENRRCETCKHINPGYFCPGCWRGDKWEWRGV